MDGAGQSVARQVMEAGSLVGRRGVFWLVAMLTGLPVWAVA